ncbi:hypothetical protein ASPCAL00928 [Aspergillus calidoustus]|uniref:Uncharacterized protein n=1 Tax=Aspergillus calidoustus TaxID=454130 RepID=A0A0U5FW98_ASPCI|nr:hypothetical protein ASPCAL00928 [Aspergillus calidoustus]
MLPNKAKVKLMRVYPLYNLLFSCSLPLLSFSYPHHLVVSIASTVLVYAALYRTPLVFIFCFFLPYPLSSFLTRIAMLPPAPLSWVRPPVDPNSILARVQARLVSRLTLQPRASTPANLDPPVRSFLPSLPRRERVRYLHTRSTAPTSLLSFNRTPAPTARPSFTRNAVPTYRPSFLRDAIVEQRRLASNKPAAPTGVVRKNKPGKSVRFAEEVTVRPVTRWINEPVKHVHFAPTVEVIPVSRWINAPTKSVSFSSLKTVIPVTRWIDRREHVSRIPVLRTRFRATHALSNAQIDTTRKVSDSRAKPVKHVHFGETTTHTVTRWIEPAVHVSCLPLRSRNYRLTGWSVIPFSKPDKSGEEARYVASWSFRSYATLPKHASKPGNHGHAPAHSVSRLVSRPDILNEIPTWSSSSGFTRRRQFASGDTPCYNHGLPTAYSFVKALP